MPRAVVISVFDTTLDAFYDQIQASIDARFHNYELTPECLRMGKSMSEAQRGEIETLTAYAAHAGGDQHDSRLYVNGVHIERLIR